MKANLFTVVIAQKKHLDCIADYELFLHPLLDRGQVVFCPWDIEAASPREAVPELAEAVGRHERWRAVIVADESGLERKNPFDLVSYSPPLRGKASLEEYQEEIHRAKKAAYDAAARLPLPRLAAWLCEEPLSNPGKNGLSAEPEYAEYLWEAEYKHSLRAGITGGSITEIALPAEVCCIAMRCCQDKEYEVNVSWQEYPGGEYSRFYDWNLYFDKMRFLVFDVLPRKHQDYFFSYIRFLYTLLLLAGNDMPSDVLLPRRLFRLECENDENALRRLLVSYDDKLEATAERINDEIESLEREKKSPFTDAEAERRFCRSEPVYVTMEEGTDESPLYADIRGVGLAGDCPGSELNRWETAFRRAEYTLRKLMKQPRRSLARGVSAFHDMDLADTEGVMQLTRFQVEDIREHIAEAEREMLRAWPRDITDLSEYQRRMAEEDKAVRREIGVRMKRGTVISIGVIVIGVYLACYLPLLLRNAISFGAVFGALVLMAAAGGLMVLVGLGCLMALRLRLVWRLRHFNEVMRGIFQELLGSLTGYSRYLSSACTMQRGASVINYLNEHEDTGLLRVRVRRKHLYEIAARRAELRDVFGCFLTERSCADPNLGKAFDYDFDRPVCYPYPMPFTEGERKPITFLREGNKVFIPVDFVRTLTVRMEELYD